MFFIKKAFAIETVTATNFGVRDALGSIGSIQQGFLWFINFCIYLGWILTIIGVALSLWKLIYEKYINTTGGEEGMTAFAQATSKAVLVIVSGIILLCAGYLFKVITTFFGLSIDFGVPVQLK